MINKRYEIIKKLGQGRSSVFLCSDNEFPDSQTAIKILSSDAGEKERENFIKEFFTLQKLDHPNIIKAYEIGTVVHKDGETDIHIGSLYITLEYFEAFELLNSGLTESEQNLKEIILQICSVLYYLHQSKYIYYDLKPENILVALHHDKPVVKLIDLGLAEYSPVKKLHEVKGTAQYIAPELLKKEDHDHKVDLYSLGMMLYRIIYNRFPFETKKELEIYKAQIEAEFDFPPAENYSEDILKVIKKLLSKDPVARYSNVLQVLTHLNIPLDLALVKDFTPAKVFSGREEAIKKITLYIDEKTGSEIFTIKGFDGVGKTTFLNKLHELRNNSVFVPDVKGKSGADLLRYVLKKVFFCDAVYLRLNDEEKAKVLNLIDATEYNLISNINSVFRTVLVKCTFVLLIDDFNLFDNLTEELFREIIPLLQINNIKVIIAESSERHFHSDKLNNVKEIILGSLTDDQLSEFLDDSYSENFPKVQLHQMILTYSDLVPGNIVTFIKDMILLNVLRFTAEGVIFADDEDKLAALKDTHSAIYDLRLRNLDETEMNSAKIISAFDIVIDVKILSVILGFPLEETAGVIGSLQLNNIIQHFSSGTPLVFTSDGLKRHIYSLIQDKASFHHNLASKIDHFFHTFNRTELSRQYEMAGKYDVCYEVMNSELAEAEKHSAYSYMKKILEYLLQLPLSSDYLDKIKIKLCEAYYKLSDFQSTLNTISSIEKFPTDLEVARELNIIESGSLIGLGEYDKAQEIINKLLGEIGDENKRQELLIELAYADFERKRYTEAKELCENLLKESSLKPELKGKCYNLKGMFEIYKNNDLNSALNDFNYALKYYTEADQPRRVAGVEVNVGNIYNILGDYDKAEERWKNASRINESVGNLDQEGMLLQNFGNFYFEKQKFDLAIDSYHKSLRIFLSIGNSINHGLVLINLAEVYMVVCEYQKAFNSVIEAQKLFEEKENYEELSEALFMLCKFYFRIGYNEKLEETYHHIRINYSKYELPSRHNTYQRFLEQLLLFCREKTASEEELKSIGREFYELEERYNYAETNFLLVEVLLLKKKNIEALEIINQPSLIDLCSQNSILEAERVYFLGKISQQYASDTISPPLDYFEKAYGLLKNESISEVTWKTLMAITELYIERGNFNKAKNYTVYARELIHFIAERIEFPRLRAAYLKHPERLQALRKLENFYTA